MVLDKEIQNIYHKMVQVQDSLNIFFPLSPPLPFLLPLLLSLLPSFLPCLPVSCFLAFMIQSFMCTAEPAMTLNSWPVTGAEIAHLANSFLNRVNGWCIYLSVGISLSPSLCGEAPVTTSVKNVALSPSVWSVDKQSTETSLFPSSSALHRWPLFFPQ